VEKSCYSERLGGLRPRKRGFFPILTNDMEPAQSVIDEPHNHRDDDDCDDPANEGINETEATAKYLEQNAACPIDQVRVCEASCSFKCRRTRTDEGIHALNTFTNNSTVRRP